MVFDLAAYVLTIPRLADRLATCRAAWRGLPLEPVFGVDYCDFPGREERPKYYFHFATILGHVRMWEIAETVGAEWNLFLEDGSRPKVAMSDLRRIVNSARSCFAWDVLRLDALCAPAVTIGWLDARHTHQIAVPSNHSAAGAYLIPRRMLARVLKTRWLCPADVHLANCGRNLSIFPAPIDHGPTTFGDV